MQLACLNWRFILLHDNKCTKGKVIQSVMYAGSGLAAMYQPSSSSTVSHTCNHSHYCLYLLHGSFFQGEKEGPKVMDEYCRDLNAEVRSGRIDPVIGREREVARVCQILARCAD